MEKLVPVVLIHANNRKTYMSYLERHRTGKLTDSAFDAAVALLKEKDKQTVYVEVLGEEHVQIQ